MRKEAVLSLPHVGKNVTHAKLDNEKKKMGVFYTPFETSEILCNWAIHSKKDLILEPSFGGCNFLEAARKRLILLGAIDPANNLYGCDIDKEAFVFLKEKIGIETKNRQFINDDFLKLTYSNFSSSKFNVIIGNPPYISLHNMSEEQKYYALTALKSYGNSLPNRASLWVYFILHSLNFLQKGGRMAWVLPGSLLFAHYAAFLREILQKSFRRILAIQLGVKLFIQKGSDESTIILLCDGFKCNSNNSYIEFGFAYTLKELANLMSSWNTLKWEGKQWNSRPELLLMDDATRYFFKIALSDKQMHTLGEFAKISTGIVTGANHFFIISRRKVISHDLPEYGLKWILPKFHLCKGLSISHNIMKSICDTNERCFFVDTSKMKKNDALSRYIKKFPEDQKKKNCTFKKRAVWHQPIYGKIPDAFFPYMHNDGPRLVLNNAGINCTNTIHRVFFNSTLKEHEKKLISISILTTFSQLSAEIEGRCYGSGVLKHEPKEAMNIRLLMPANYNSEETNKVFNLIEMYIRNNQIEEAQNEADKFIFARYLKKYGPTFVEQLRIALTNARCRRGKKF